MKVWVRWLVHGALFASTFLMATLMQGPTYAAAIMAILLAHELGHYFTCRHYGVPVTFPIFIPMYNLFGTMGAVIAIKGRIPNRKVLFDIGVSGPLIGLAFAIPAIVIGIILSHVGSAPTEGTGVSLGEPLLFTWLARLIKGPIPETRQLILHPLGFAGWAALFVTSINLLPAGQLDGGHIIHALFGPRRGKWISWLVVATLLYFGYRYHPMWIVFAALIILLLLRNRPPAEYEASLSKGRWMLALLTCVLMILCFTPVPIDIR
ncbi:MAG: site-2 protease family protein [Pseudomonadota bacterium]